MSVKSFEAQIISNEVIAKDIYRMVFTMGSEQLSQFVPGQFAHIKVPNMGESILRRPISINGIDKKNGTVTICYAVVGKGTRALSQLEAGDKMDVLCPLGNGFPVEEYSKIWVVGGGIGIAPLASVVNNTSGKEVTAFLGYKSKEYVYGLDDFAKCRGVFVTTDDGSFGEKGFVTAAVAKKAKTDKPEAIFVCGPTPLFKALKKAVEGLNIKTYISLEQRMGCGTGGCSTCVCKVGGEYKKVCHDGPVFPMEEVEL